MQLIYGQLVGGRGAMGAGGTGGVTRDRVIKSRLIVADICQESANEPSNGSFARPAL